MGFDINATECEPITSMPAEEKNSALRAADYNCWCDLPDRMYSLPGSTFRSLDIPRRGYKGPSIRPGNRYKTVELLLS